MLNKFMGLMLGLGGFWLTLTALGVTLVIDDLQQADLEERIDLIAVCAMGFGLVTICVGGWLLFVPPKPRDGVGWDRLELDRR